MNTVQPPGISVEARPVDAQATRQGLRVGAIGHRNLRGADEHVRTMAHALFAQWRAEYATVEVYSALAIGSDTILAEVALDLGLPLVVVVPFSGCNPTKAWSSWPTRSATSSLRCVPRIADFAAHSAPQ